MRRKIPFQLIAQVALKLGAVEVFWQESDRAFTGFVAEVWFDAIEPEFAVFCARAVGYPILMRPMSEGIARFMISVPVNVPQGQVKLGQPSRGSKVRLVHE
jgi:hypothetical protein